MRMMDRRGMSFRARVFWAIFCVSLLSVWLSLFHARTLLEEKQMGSAREELLRECRMAASLYAARAAGGGDVHALLRLLGHERARVSLVDAAGTVRAESSSRLGERELDNHNDRPEIMEARARGDGYAVRESGSLNEPFAYAAHALTDGSVLRLAVPLAELTDAIDSRLSVLSRLAVAALLLSAVLAVLISGALRRSVDHMVSAVTAIARGNFHRRLRRVPGGEFAPLAEAVNGMARNIEEQIAHAADQAAQLESVLTIMGDGVLVLDRWGHVRRSNRALERVFPEVGLSLGRPLIGCIPAPALQRAVETLLEDAAPDTQTIMHVQLELPSGRNFSVRLARADEVDARVGVVAVFHDITELMRLERVRRDFVANVSHELRTPLTAIQGCAETLAEVEDIAKCRHFAAIIHKHGSYLSAMIQDLLALARLENEDGMLRLAPVSLEDAVMQAQSLCADLCSRRHATLAADIPEALEVMAHEETLCMVLRNIFENAYRFSPENGTVRVWARREGDRVLVRVADDGPGIAPDHLERVFERFYRVEGHRGQQSTGLGLAICKHAVERHGGRIWAESPARDGHTAIVFTLAAARAAEDASPARALPGPEGVEEE